MPSTRALDEFLAVTRSMGWEPGMGYLFPSVTREGKRGSSKMTAAEMTASLQASLRNADLEDGRKFTMHPFRVGGAVSQT